MSDDDYYNFFDGKTDNGQVLTDDLSSETVSLYVLTGSEVASRKSWNETLEAVYNHYRGNDAPEPPIITTAEGVLCQRIVAPKMATSHPSRRSRTSEARAGRSYPPPDQVCEWEDFLDGVGNFDASNIIPQRPGRFHDIFLSILEDANIKERRSEKDEERYLINNLESMLVYSGLVDEIGYDAEGIVGKPDFLFLTNEQNPKKKMKKRAAVIAETKSTHNLLLPISSSEVVEAYEKGYEDVLIACQKRTNEWSHVCHPIAQLLGYMVDNRCPYGALTSSSRTYFIHIAKQKKKPVVMISDAYLVGEPGYLRAWAYIYSLGRDEEAKSKSLRDKTWTVTSSNSPTPQPSDDEAGREGSKKRKGDAGSSGGTKKKGKTKDNSSRTASTRSNAASLSDVGLPQVDFDRIKLGKVIGEGRNGSVFEVRWKGKKVALKQFDVGRDGVEAYESELSAYARMKPAWGELVPEPLFLSESPSGGVKFLGLQLGRDPNENDDVSGWESLLDKIRRKYGVRHIDSFGRNGLVITDRDGRDRLVAIDFEFWEDAFSKKLPTVPTFMEEDT